MSQQLIDVVQAVNAARQAAAYSRIPKNLRGSSFFSEYDLWDYQELGDPEDECEYCKEHGDHTYSGSELRSLFPDLIVVTEDAIYPNVHMTLWGKQTCKCLLTRNITTEYTLEIFQSLFNLGLLSLVDYELLKKRKQKK